MEKHERYYVLYLREPGDDYRLHSIHPDEDAAWAAAHSSMVDGNWRVDDRYVTELRDLLAIIDIRNMDAGLAELLGDGGEEAPA